MMWPPQGISIRAIVCMLTASARKMTSLVASRVEETTSTSSRWEACLRVGRETVRMGSLDRESTVHWIEVVVGESSFRFVRERLDVADSSALVWSFYVAGAWRGLIFVMFLAV
jgi:hypothetical protein